MNFTELFIRRPVMTTLVMAGILIFGLVAYRQLPVSDLPAVDYPTISVSASLSGASPETMASSVATPLEKEFSTIPGVETMTSTSTQGSTSISLQFALSRNIDAAAQDVQDAISQAQRQLPRDVLPPSFRKVDPSSSPILYYALRTTTLPLPQLNEYAETFLAQRLSTIDGVAQVQVFGSMKYAVRIQIDPQELAARSIGIDEVSNAIENGNVNLPTGILWGTDKAYAVESQGQLNNARDFGALVVTYRDGAPVRLRDLGKVIDSVQDTKRASWFNGQRAVVLAVQRQPGTNTVAVAERVKAEVERLRPQIPPAIDIATLNDRSLTVKASVTDVKFTLFLALCLVVLENIVRHIEGGEPVRHAAIRGSREISFTVLSMTLSLVAVFIPVLFLGGLIGRLFQEFAVTIGVAILVSGVVSLTLTPMLCSRWLKLHEPNEQHGRFYRAIESAWDMSHSWYQRSLHWTMERRPLMLAFGGAILLGTVLLGRVVPKGFIPSEDQSQLYATTEAAEGTSYDAMVKHQLEAAAIVQEDPNIDGFMSAVGGGGGSSAVNQGRLIIHLKPRDQRRMSADEVARSLTRKLAAVTGIRAFVQNPPVINIGGRSSKSLY